MQSKSDEDLFLDKVNDQITAFSCNSIDLSVCAKFTWIQPKEQLFLTLLSQESCLWAVTHYDLHYSRVHVFLKERRIGQIAFWSHLKLVTILWVSVHKHMCDLCFMLFYSWFVFLVSSDWELLLYLYFLFGLNQLLNT